MLAIIFSIIMIIAGIVIGNIIGKLRAEDQDEPFHFISWPLLIAIVLSIGMLFFSSMAIVPTGFTGILTTFGRVEDRTINAGMNFIAPWQNVVTMDNRTQKVELTLSAFSSDIQQVDVKMSTNYCIDQNTAQKLYKTIGVNYYEAVMLPRIQENVKAVFSKYTAENLIAKRESLSEQIKESTAKDLESFGITIVNIAIEDIDFTDAFTNAVEAKQVAAQNKLTAQTQQEQKTMEERAAAERVKIAAQGEADKAIIAANADLEVVKVQAEAALYAGEREAEMNQRISKSLTDELVSYYWIKQWNGELPTTVLSDDGNYMLALNQGE